MSDLAPNPPPSGFAAAQRAALTPLLFIAATPFTLSLLLSSSAYASAGPSLGLFLGCLAMVTFITPPLVLAQSTWPARAFSAAAILLPVIGLWLIPLSQSSITFIEWLRAILVLAAYMLSLIALAAAMQRLWLPPVLAAGLTVLFGAAYLTWPVWLAPHLTGANREELVAALVIGHPLFTLNGLLQSAFPVPWAQYKFAYILTNIGDDIPYELPRSILPCLAIHAALAAFLLLMSFIGPRPKPLADKGPLTKDKPR
jgi:hypothetical protein